MKKRGFMTNLETKNSEEKRIYNKLGVGNP